METLGRVNTLGRGFGTERTDMYCKHRNEVTWMFNGGYGGETSAWGTYNMHAVAIATTPEVIMAFRQRIQASPGKEWGL